MKRNSIFFNSLHAVCLLFIVTTAIFAGADDQPKTKALKKEDSDKAIQLARAYQSAVDAYNQADLATLNAPLDDCAKVVAAEANKRIAFVQLRAAESAKSEHLASLQKIYDFEGGTFAPDGKSLVRAAGQ